MMSGSALLWWNMVYREMTTQLTLCPSNASKRTFDSQIVCLNADFH